MIKLPYEKLLIWQKAMDLARLIYMVTKSFPKEELFGLTSQMRRSAVSIPSNIAEGSQRSGAKDFAHFILMAKGSLAELKTQTILAKDATYLSNQHFTDTIEKIEELDKMLRSFYLKITGGKY